MRIPPTLSPKLLKKIFTYANNQKRKIETDLIDEFRFSWKLCHVADQGFYDQLHRFLQNPSQRVEFNRIAFKHSKRRKLDLYNSIYRHYSRLYPGIRKIKEKTPLTRVHFYATNDDVECLTNIVWLLIEIEELSEKQVQELFDQYPQLKESLGDTYSTQDSSSWEQAVRDLNDLAEELQTFTNPNIQLANRLEKAAHQLKNIAKTNQQEFWIELDRFVTKHSEYFNEHKDFHHKLAEFSSAEFREAVSSDWRPRLKSIKQNISESQNENQRFKRISEQLNKAPPADQLELVGQLQQSIERRNEIDDQIRSTVKNLFDQNQGHIPEPTPPETTPPETTPPETTPPETTPPETTPPETTPPETTPPETTPPEPEPPETTPPEPTPPEPEPESPEINLARALLNRLLDQGDFAHAYWVAKASNTFDANILGVLSEGSNVKPSSSCSAQLENFIEQLTESGNRTDEENLLLVAAIIQPLIFLQTKPNSLYHVASNLHDTQIERNFEVIRKNFLYQSNCLESNTVHSNDGKSQFYHELQQLSVEAGDFLKRIPSINFKYQPAKHALEYLYGDQSSWYALHSLVADRQIENLEKVEKLLMDLDPRNELRNIHNSVETIRKPLEGHAKVRLERILSNSISLAKTWVDLVRKNNMEEPETHQVSIESLKQTTIDTLKEALVSLENGQTKSPAINAATKRICDLLSVLEGNPIGPTTGINEVCISLPGIRLNDKMRLADEESIDHLIDAIQQITENGFNVKQVFEECLEHDEFIRAHRLIEIHHLEDVYSKKLEIRLIERKDELKKQFDELEAKVEEAFFLGELWHSDHTPKDRTDLLSLVSEGQENLKINEQDRYSKIRSASKIEGQIDKRIEEIEKKRILPHLKDQKENVERKLSESLLDKSDIDYFQKTFNSCLRHGNYVTAFDLLERTRKAIEMGNPIDRTIRSNLSGKFLEFLKFTEQFRKEFWKDRHSRVIQTFVNAIQKSQTHFSIPFGQIDNARRQEAISALKIWKNLKELSDIENICRFLGFSVARNKAQTDNEKNGLYHVRVTLDSVSSYSPLPGFGSTLESRLDIVICNRSHEPGQITEFIKQIEIPYGKAVLVFLTRPLKERYRLEWLKKGVERRLMMLPLDSALMMFLCGERNRQSALLKISLPFTWAQPYITQGETVTPEMFVGRRNEVADLIDPNGSCIVFGGRQLGKSALLSHVRREFHKPQSKGGLFVAYLDVDTCVEFQTSDEMRETFWKQVLNELQSINAIKENSIERKRGRLPKFTETVPKLIGESLSADDEKHIVLLLDETDTLLDLDAQMDFSLVRQLRAMMAGTNRRFKVVLAGLQSVQRYNNWKNHPFAQLGREIVVDPLAPKDAEDLIVRPFRTLGFKFENLGLVSRIVSITNYHPGLIQIFCYRLLEHLYSRYSIWTDPIRYVKENDVLAIERNPMIKQDIRDRFDWTLDLDPTYKVITYALVLEEEPTVAKSVNEFKHLGEKLWPQVFGGMDTQAMRAVLDEMVGLGVLSTKFDDIEQSIYRYRLRSPNLLRLLGSKGGIETKLLETIDADRISRPNPRNFRFVSNNPICCSPLTKEQEGYISASRDKFELSVILGSSAMGLQDVAPQIRRVIENGVASDEWREIELTTIGGMDSADKIVDRLKRKFKENSHYHRYVIINLENLVIYENLGELVDKMIIGLKRTCKPKSRGKVIIIANPDWVWNWTRSSLRVDLEDRTEVTVMQLKRWSPNAISNALDQISKRTNSQSEGVKIFEITHGLHSLISKILSDTNKLKGSSAKPATKRAKELAATLSQRSVGDRWLSDLGILNNNDDSLQKAVIALLCSGDEQDEEYVISDDSAKVAALDFLSASRTRQLLDQEEKKVYSWLRALDLIWPLDKNKSMFKPCPLTLKLIQDLYG